MSKKEFKPKLDVDAIHKEIKNHFKGFDYLILTEKDEHDELFVMTNFKKEKVILLLKDLVSQLEENTAIESNIGSKNLKDLNATKE